MKHIYLYLFSALLIVSVSSCSSSKKVTAGASIGNLTETEYVRELIELSPAWDALTAKMSLSVTTGADKSPTKLGGTLRIKRDEMIQVSVTYLLGIEVARIEIAPDGAKVIDRMNKQYVELSFDELEGLSKTDMDFHTLQSLFLNELFLPGKKKITSRDVSSFSVTADKDSAWVEVKDAERFSYRFRTNTSDGQLRETHIGVPGASYGLDWQYDKFRELEKGLFPSYMQVSVEGAKKLIKAEFEFSRLSTDSDWETHTSLSKKYEKVEWKDLVKELSKK